MKNGPAEGVARLADGDLQQWENKAAIICQSDFTKLFLG